MSIKLWIKLTQFFLVIMLIISVIVMGYLLFFKKESEMKVVSSPITETKAEVLIGEIAFHKAIQTGKLYGYENNMDFTYKFVDTPENLKNNKEDNKITKGLKNFGKAFADKEYEIKLNSNIMLGYDLSKMTEDQFIWNKETKTLTIVTPKLNLVYTPNFNNSEFKSSVGAFRTTFTEEERRMILADAVEQGSKEVLNNKQEIKIGYDMTNNFLKELLYKLPEVAENVSEIVFLHHNNDVELITENENGGDLNENQ